MAVADIHIGSHSHAHDAHHDEHEHGHHKQSFITHYIFSTDHKMIAKQYLITGILMGGTFISSL